MAWTSHGHHVPGTTTNGQPTSRARCGGPTVCVICKTEVGHIVGEPTDYQSKAKRFLIEHVDAQIEEEFSPVEKYSYEVYIIWSAKILKNWKGILGTTMPDSKMYEITYDGNENRWYFDEYTKTNHRIIPG